ncbi:MAG: hypothetical protein IJY06_07445 [Oscillospiraceae bacterium]|nr:hypothetical protein [Oscillospiraceae bacterium]
MGCKKLKFILFSACLLFTACDMQEVPDGESSVMPSETQTTEAVQTSAVQELLSSMTLEEKVWQMFIITPEQLTGVGCATRAGQTTAEAVAQMPVGGVIYFSQNLETPEQTAEMLTKIQQFAKDTSGIGLFLAVDEEGGLVARCADKLGTTALSDMAVYGARNDAAEAYEIGQTLGSDIGALGFNLDFAPVADVDLCDGNELGGRIFSDDPQVVANMVSGVVRGMQDTGVSATLKHFPGLGAEDGNSHEDSHVIIDRTLEELRSAEFVPFQAGIDAGAEFVMVGHQIMTCTGDELPSDLSHTAVTDYLRGELGFEGIAVTDSHLMNTISEVYTSGEAAVLAIEAGMDIVLMPVDVQEAVDAVCAAVQEGRLTEERINESLLRILAEKEEMGLV